MPFWKVCVDLKSLSVHFFRRIFYAINPEASIFPAVVSRPGIVRLLLHRNESSASYRCSFHLRI